MKEQRLICDRCDATAVWDDNLREWWSLTPDADQIRIYEDRVERIDLCPNCRYEFEEWMLKARGELTETAETYLEGMRLLREKDE